MDPLPALSKSVLRAFLAIALLMAAVAAQAQVESRLLPSAKWQIQAVAVAWTNGVTIIGGNGPKPRPNGLPTVGLSFYAEQVLLQYGFKPETTGYQYTSTRGNLILVRVTGPGDGASGIIARFLLDGTIDRAPWTTIETVELTSSGEIRATGSAELDKGDLFGIAAGCL